MVNAGVAHQALSKEQLRNEYTIQLPLGIEFTRCQRVLGKEEEEGDACNNLGPLFLVRQEIDAVLG